MVVIFVVVVINIIAFIIHNVIAVVEKVQIIIKEIFLRRPMNSSLFSDALQDSFSDSFIFYNMILSSEERMSITNIRLGPNESKLIFTLEKNGQILFTFKEAKQILETSDSSTWNILSALKQKKRIRQIQKGMYLLSPARSGIEGEWTEHVFTILSKLLGKDYYVGLWSALSYWGMTEQIPQTIYVIVTRQRKNLRFDNQMIQFVTYSSSRFFGYTQERIGESKFSVSTREKTIIDSLAHLEYAGGISEVAKAIWTAKGELNLNEMIDCAENMGIHAVTLRLGYLLELLDFGKELYEGLLPGKHMGAPWLDPSSKKNQIEFSGRWGLRINVPQEVTLHWK